MASSVASSKVSLKLLIDKKGQRVLFAEAGKDFIDFLFSLLVLPVATVIRLIDNRDMVGGLGKLYHSVSDLKDDYIQSDQQKDALLKPKCMLPFFCPQVSVLPNAAFSSPSPTTNSTTRLYKCGNCNSGLLTLHAFQKCTSCSYTMSTMDDMYVLESAADAKGGGFVKGLVTYMVMDDLSVSPMSTTSNIASLIKFKIKDLDALEEKVVHIGMNEGLQLLKHSLNSKTVLTDVFLGELVVKDNDNINFKFFH